ncbi:hypothetical protein U5A82_07415 [Sphingobium sp. CR2-8]|uniref:hypothetical protein n=1 Tax=Sphingobium sp. CR2-8 TaxID=1306534 RepID=UPI002DBF8A78|nr:hypothetical protein [Sphingobium sp. CR2-8]MEC3910317.1 hypothetical protein [Sphingobium sp. CR2-8]
MNKVQLVAMIRFNLSEMKARNAHHEFEHLARYLARAKVHSNILPATGPVSAGGDEGRDFETYRSSITRPISAVSNELSSGLRRVRFGCSLATKITSKIKSDVKTMAAPGTADAIAYFCEANVPIKKRLELTRWATSEHSLELQIFDGTAIAEMLADADVFWIAQQYLHLPADAFPTHAGDQSWYPKHRDRWRGREPMSFSTSDFFEVKSGLRYATFNEEGRPDLLEWLKLTEAFRVEPCLREMARAAAYEIAVANLRGKTDLDPAKHLIVDFFSDVDAWLAPSDLQDAATLVSYAFGAWVLGHFSGDLTEVLVWRGRIATILDREVDASEGPGRLAALLRIRASLATVPIAADTAPDLSAGFDDWERMLDAAHSAPLFPIEDFTDFLNKLTPMLGNHPRFEALAERAEDLVAKKAGPAVAADKSFDRAVLRYEQDDLLLAVHDFHRIQHRWFSGDRLEGFQRATFLLSKSYLELGLAYAAKYMALVGSYLAQHSERPEVKAQLPQMLMLVADADDAAGNSLSYVQTLLPVIGAHFAFEPDPFDQDRHPELTAHLGQVAALRGITGRLGSAHMAIVDQALARWPEHLRHSVVASSDGTDGFWFKGGQDDVWQGIEEAFIGRPFGDLGKQRLIEWRALGVRWVATFQNTYGHTAIAEEFVAQLQIVQATLGGVDLMLLPTIVRMELALATGPEDVGVSKGKGWAKGQGITFSVRLPPNDQAAADIEEGIRSAGKMTAVLISLCSVLPHRTLTERTGPLVRMALDRIFVGRPYREIYRETMLQDLFLEEERLDLEPLARERSFASREHPQLGSPQGPGQGYDKESALQSIGERYERAAGCIRHTLRRLLARPDRRVFLESWHREGMLDWEILSIVANAAANIRFPITDDSATAEQLEQVRGMFDQKERVRDALDPALFTDELLIANRQGFHGALAAGWQLQGSPALSDRDAVEKFLIQRYGLRSDDIKHSDLFKWGGAALS